MGNNLGMVVVGCLIAAKLTLAYWLISQVPWVGVFLSNGVLGLCLVRCWQLSDEVDGLWEDKKELEKQVVALRTTIDHMARARLEDEVDRRRVLFYCRNRSSGSSRSL